MKIKYLLIVGAIALFLAIYSWSYDYYVLLRWGISIIAGYSAFKFYEAKQNSLTYVLSGVVILFNPILPVYLTKGIWVILDICVAFIFLHAAGKVTVK